MGLPGGLGSQKKILTSLMHLPYILFLLFILASTPTLACECGIMDEQEIERATTIFEGIPISSYKSEDGSMVHYQFQVSRLWKGESKDTISIKVFSPDLSSCFVKFSVDRKYLVFAYGNSTHTCTFNSEVVSSTIIGLLRYKLEEGFKEKLGKDNRKRLKKEEAFYLNSKLRSDRGKLDFSNARVVFVDHEKKIRKKEYFSQWGGTINQERLIILGPVSRRFLKADALVIVNPIRDYKETRKLEWFLVKLKRQ